MGGSVVSGGEGGMMSLDGHSTLNVAGGCDSVDTSGNSRCNNNAGEYAVTIDTSEQDQVVHGGTRMCWASWGSSAAAGEMTHSATVVTATAAAAVGLVAFAI